MFRKSVMLLSVLMLMLASTAFAGVHFGMIRTIGHKAREYGRIAVHVDVPTNGGCLSSPYIGGDGIQVFVRGTEPATRARYTNSVWDHVYVNRGGNARLLIAQGDIGIKSLTFQWADGRHEHVMYPSFTRDSELGRFVYARDFHPRFYPEVLTVTVEYISAFGSNGGTEQLQYTFMAPSW